MSSKIKCRGLHFDLHDVDFDERRKIKWRCCDPDLHFENAKICQNHKDLLGKRFTKITKTCFWPTHKKTWGTVRPQRVEREESFYFYEKYGIFLPFMSKVCKFCMEEFNLKLTEKNFDKDDYPTPKSVVGLDLGQRDEPMPIDDDDYVPDAGDIIHDPDDNGDTVQEMDSETDCSKPEALLNLLKSTNIQLEPQFMRGLKKSYGRSGNTKQWQVQKLISAGFASVLHSVTPVKADDTQMYKDVLESNYVEKFLIGKPMPSEDLVASIREYNHAPTDSARLQIYSRLAVRFGFKKLSKYNSPLGHQTDYDDIDELGDEEETETLDYDPNDIGVCWCPMITKHFHQKAIKHFYKNNYSTAPVVEKEVCRWRVMESVVEEITTFVMDHCTESLAYGVRDVTINTPEGPKKVPVVKTYRRQNDEDLAKMIIAHLKDKDLPIPSKSYIKKLLREAMPAEKTKEVCGVNSFAEDANEGFQTLRRLLEEMRLVIGEDNFKTIDANLAKVKTYLKSHYSQNLALESPIISHCAIHACSDPNNPNLQKDCSQTHEHTQECDWCNQLNRTFDVFSGLIAEYVNTLDCEIKKDIVLEDSEEALKNIAKYQAHLVKAFIQKELWVTRFENLDEKVIFVTCDWSQKLNPKEHREKQSSYFGKRGISMHVTVVERIRAEKDANGIVQKYFIETDVFATIIDKDSIQDAGAVAGIICVNLQSYKTMHPSVKSGYLRSDCAGCYKSAKCLEAMWQIRRSIPDFLIRGWFFSAPQAGKSKCDTVSFQN